MNDFWTSLSNTPIRKEHEQYVNLLKCVEETSCSKGVDKGVYLTHVSTWHHQMETFSALLALCVGNSPVTGEFPSQRPVTRSFDAFFDLRLNKRLSKQAWRRLFETPSRSFWRHCNVLQFAVTMYKTVGISCSERYILATGEMSSMMWNDMF